MKKEIDRLARLSRADFVAQKRASAEFLGITVTDLTRLVMAAARRIKAEERDAEADTAEYMRLASLNPLDYDRERDEAAEKLGVRKTTLDDQVARHRADRKDATKLFLVDPPAWPEPVDGAVLLDAIETELRRYLVMPEPAYAACALWILHAHAHDAFQCSPLLALLSPEKRCGKTTTLNVILGLLPRALLASNISAASIFRVVDKYKPTLLVDELDTFIKDNDELRGIVNAGHRRDAAVVIRVSGEELEPRAYSCWAPKVVAMIGRLPSTLADRSIEVPLKRKLPREKVTRFRSSRPGALPDLKRQCIRWAADNLDALRNAALAVDAPDTLNDRACDNWEPLLTIADAAGATWPDRARNAALALSGEAVVEDESIRAMLLADIRQVFAAHGEDGVDGLRISSATLATKLSEMEDRPWPEWRGKPITTTAIARILNSRVPPAERIVSKNIRFDGRVPKGYELSQFVDAFERYLSSETPATTAITATALKQNDNSVESKRYTDDDVAVSKQGKPQQHQACSGCSGSNPPPRENKKLGQHPRRLMPARTAAGTAPLCRMASNLTTRGCTPSVGRNGRRHGRNDRLATPWRG